MSALQLLGLRHCLGGKVVLDGVSLEISAGQFFVILGPSGSGKTTLLRLIAGLERPTAGHVLIGQKEATPLPPEQRGVAMVFQHAALFPHLTVAENVEFGLKMRRADRSERIRRATAALQSVQMAEFAARYPSQLSGGQQQRVALARALAVQPEILLLDEPFSHLDPGLQREMQLLVRRLQRESGVTTVMVTHDRDEGLQLADRIGILLGGRFVQAGSPPDVLFKPASLGAAAFLQIGNLVPGEVRGAVFYGSLGGGPMPERPGGWRDGPARAVIPPEALQVRPCLKGHQGVVTHTYASTAGLMAGVMAAGQLLTARLSPEAAIASGDTVCVAWDSRAVWYVYEE